MKRILAATAVTLLAVSATACGSGDSDSGGKTKVVFSYWGSDSRQKLTEAAIAKFEEKNPTIDVEGDFSDWDSYYEKLATKTAPGDAPDVMSIEIRGLGEYAGRGILADVKGKVNTVDLDQGVLKAGQVDGKQYAIPTGVNAFPMIVNEKTLKKYDQKVPDDKTWTWDDYISISQKVTEKSGGDVWGTEYNENPAFLQIFAAQRGEQFYAYGGKVALSEQTIKDWWALLQKIIDTKAGPGAAQMLETGTKVDQAMLATNKSAFGSWWSNQLDTLTKGSGQDLELLRMPRTAGASSSGMFLQPMYYTISSKTEQAAAAQKFVEFLVNDPDAGAILLSDRGLPTNAKVVAAIKSKLSPADQKVLESGRDQGRPQPDLRPAEGRDGDGGHPQARHRLGAVRQGEAGRGGQDLPHRGQQRPVPVAGSVR